MNRIVTSETTSSPTTTAAGSSYAERRAAMADETRTRILEACVAILGRGVAELSIPAVAREAGVSVPTVYRNFPDKKTLVHETALYLRSLRMAYAYPVHIDELPAHLKQSFVHSSSLADNVRAALASELISEAKRELGEPGLRLAHTEKMLADVLATLAPADRPHAVHMITVLCSSATLRAFREVSGATPEAAADTVAWTIARILDRPWQATAAQAAPPTTTTSAPTRAKRRKKGSR